MAELRARLEALERRMERAEAALRFHRVPVLFEDVAVRFSRQEWASLDEGQKEMYRSVMEGNYEMLMSLYCALSKPELLLQLEREELSTPPESEPEAAEVSPELAVEPARQNCTSDDALLETETVERGCREPEQSGNVAEESRNLEEESKNLVEESRSLVEISWNMMEESENPVEENRSPAEENRSLAKESGNPAEESGNLMEESRSPVVPENCSTPECLENPAAAVRSPGSLPDCSSPTFKAALALTAPLPLEAAAVLADLSQPSPPRPLSVHCLEAVGQNGSPPAAGDAEVGIPTEVPQEEIAAEKPSMPKTSSVGLEEDKGLEKEAVKDSGNTGQDLVANIPEEPGKEVTPAVCRTMEQADPSPGEPEKDSCVGRPGACQRNATREFYSCPICRKTFLLKINLLIHQRGHTNWVPYVCVHCDRKFMSKKKMRRHLRAWAVNGTCQPSDVKVCSSQGPCPTSQPQTWAPNGTCQASKPEECPSRTPCPTSQPQTWAPNSSCQPSDAKVCSSQGPCPTSQPQTWAASGTCQPSDAKVCSSQGPCPISQPQTWAPNSSCQPSDAKVCSSQGPCPTSQPQTWAANGTCQASKPEECPTRTLCPTSQPQTWAANGPCQSLDAKACPSQGTLCPTSQPQNWAPNGPCQPSNAKAYPSQGPCPASQPQTWAANGTCQPSKPEECPSQTLCPSSQPQAPSRECGQVWQEPGPARCSLSPGKVMYTCNECLETFSNQVFLTVHQRRHTGHQHLILCPCCNRSFTWVSDFVRQHWTHMGVRPHQCGICQKTFKRFSHLKAHQRIHRRQEKPFTCANPVPIVAPPAAGDTVGSQDVTPQGWGTAVRP